MMTRWRLNPADIVYVGDNPVKDFQAPQQLGMKGIWFRNADGLYNEPGSASIACVDSIELLTKVF